MRHVDQTEPAGTRAAPGTRAEPDIRAEPGACAQPDTRARVEGAAAPLVLAVTGLRFEARIAAGAGVRVVCQQNTLLPGVLAELLDASLAQGYRGIVSFGTAGGLVDDLRPGMWVVARSICADEGRYDTAPAWSQALLEALPGARHADLAGVAAPLADAAAKRALQQRESCSAVDMESHIVAQLATARGLPFVCCRVVIDPLERTLPPAALAGLRTDGSTDVLAVLGSLAAHPGQLPALLRVAADAARAQRALRDGRRRMGADFAFRAA